MSESSNKSPNKDSGRNPQPERFQPKVLLIWLVIITAIIALWYSMPGAGSNQRQLSVSELIMAVNEGAVNQDSGVMKPAPTLGKEGYIVPGEMRNPKFAPEVRSVFETICLITFFAADILVAERPPPICNKLLRLVSYFITR